MYKSPGRLKANQALPNVTTSNKSLFLFLTNVASLTAVLSFWNAHGVIATPWDEPALALLHNLFSLNAEVLAPAQPWSQKQLHGLFVFFSFMLGVSAMPRGKWQAYVMAGVLACGVIALASAESQRQQFFPLASMLLSLSFMFCGMLVCLHYLKQKAELHLRATLGGRLSEASLRCLLAQRDALQLDGEEREVSLLYLQIHEHTPCTNQISAQARIKLLREFCGEVTAISIKAGGCILRNSGANLSVVFGAPLSTPNHAAQAVNAALQIQRRLLELGKQWERVGFPPQRCHFAIHTGAVLLGTFQTSTRSEYSVLGESVAFVTRLCNANETYGTSLLVSAATFAQLPPQEYRTRWLDIWEEIKIFEVYGDLATYRSPIAAAYYQNYEHALAAYHAQDFEHARLHLDAAQRLLSHDPAAHLLRQKMP